MSQTLSKSWPLSVNVKDQGEEKNELQKTNFINLVYSIFCNECSPLNMWVLDSSERVDAAHDAIAGHLQIIHWVQAAMTEHNEETHRGKS